MTRLVATFVMVAGLAAPLAAQPFATEADRREAMRHYRNGQELLTAEQWEKAATAFTAAIKLDPLFTDAHYGLGSAYMGLRRYASAAQAYARCIDAAEQLHGLRERNRIETDRRIDDEVKELRETVRRMQNQPNRQLRSQQLQQRIQDLERSRSSLGNTFEPPAGVLLALGSAHFRNGDREAAAKFWNDAVVVNSKLGEAWNNLAVIHLGSGRRQDALEAIRNAERSGFRVNPRLKEDIDKMK